MQEKYFQNVGPLNLWKPYSAEHVPTNLWATHSEKYFFFGRAVWTLLNPVLIRVYFREQVVVICGHRRTKAAGEMMCACWNECCGRAGSAVIRNVQDTRDIVVSRPASAITDSSPAVNASAPVSQFTSAAGHAAFTSSTFYLTRTLDTAYNPCLGQKSWILLLQQADSDRVHHSQN